MRPAIPIFISLNWRCSRPLSRRRRYWRKSMWRAAWSATCHCFLRFAGEALSELGRTTEADAIFASIKGHAEIPIALTEIRHALRAGRPEEADALAARLVDTEASVTAWAYRSTAWRMLQDPRYEWLSAETWFRYTTLVIACRPAMSSSIACVAFMSLRQTRLTSPFAEARRPTVRFSHASILRS